MMPSTCPDRDELRAFSSGLLPGPSFDAVAEHVERCESCESALASLDAQPDELVTRLRRTTDAAPPEPPHR